MSYYIPRRITHYYKWLHNDRPYCVEFKDSILYKKNSFKNNLRKVFINKLIENNNLENTILNMFIDISWVNYCGILHEKYPKSKSFLPYSYLTRKILELLDAKDFYEYFPYKWSLTTLKVFDKYWNVICKDLSYEFIPSI